jgi:hypothetical protein
MFSSSAVSLKIICIYKGRIWGFNNNVVQLWHVGNGVRALLSKWANQDRYVGKLPACHHMFWYSILPFLIIMHWGNFSSILPCMRQQRGGDRGEGGRWHGHHSRAVLHFCTIEQPWKVWFWAGVLLRTWCFWDLGCLLYPHYGGQ